MASFQHCIQLISKVADALISLFDSSTDKEKLLEDVDSLSEYLEKESEIADFLKSRLAEREVKCEVLDLLTKNGVHSYLTNVLSMLVDKNLIFYLDLFLSTLRTKLQKSLKIKNIYVYSAFSIIEEQKKRIESLWKVRLNDCKCKFFYATDKSLKLGIKVQVDSYVEEFSLSSNLLNVKLKLESSLF